MTTKDKLILMDEIKEHNDSMIKLFLSREPIRKRNDPRYQAKLAVKEAVQEVVKVLPEYTVITVAFIIMMVAIPVIGTLIG